MILAVLEKCNAILIKTQGALIKKICLWREMIKLQCHTSTAFSQLVDLI